MSECKLPKSLSCFSLARHEGEYETWPLETELYFNGQPTCTEVPGYVLEAQYSLDNGFLLVTTWDCPYEEMATFILLDEDLELLSRTDLGVCQATGDFKDAQWLDGKKLTFRFFNEEKWQLTIMGKKEGRDLVLAKID